MKNSNLVTGVVLIAAVLFLLFAGVGMMGLGGFGMMGPRMMGGYGAPGFGFNPFGAILSLVLWALVIGGGALLFVWLIRNAGRTRLITPSSDTALEVLKTRYARGEITKEQFDAIRQDLKA